MKTIRDTRFGEIAIYQNAQLHQTLLCKEKVVNTKEEAKKELAHLARRADMNGEGLQKLVDYSCAIQSSLCSKSFLLQAFYEVPETDLSKETKKLSGEEASQIYHSLHAGMRTYHKHDLTHDEISPLMVGRRAETKEHVLLDRLRDAT